MREEAHGSGHRRGRVRRLGAGAEAARRGPRASACSTPTGSATTCCRRRAGSPEPDADQGRHARPPTASSGRSPAATRSSTSPASRTTRASSSTRQLGKSINYDAFLAARRAVEGSRRASGSSTPRRPASTASRTRTNVTEDLPLEPLTDYSKYKAHVRGGPAASAREPGFTDADAPAGHGLRLLARACGSTCR